MNFSLFWGAINSILKKVLDFTDDRNALAHRGESIKGSVDEYLMLTENLLYVFDFLEGNEWAKTRINGCILAPLDWN